MDENTPSTNFVLNTHKCIVLGFLWPTRIIIHPIHRGLTYHDNIASEADIHDIFWVQHHSELFSAFSLNCDHARI